MKRRISILVALVALACSDEKKVAPGGAERGAVLYKNVCVVCHNADPAQDGVLGPAVAGASLELLEAKVLRGEYPDSYVPKRPGVVMPRYEYVAEALPDLAAYLARVAGE